MAIRQAVLTKFRSVNYPQLRTKLSIQISKDTIIHYLLRSIDRKEGNPPPMLAILATHISEPPILSDTPLPLFPPKVVVGKSQTPNPCQCYHNSRPPQVILGQRVCCIVINEQHWYHSPIQIYHLQHPQNKIQ